MQCLKCGKKTLNDQVFCDECLAVMEEYPVKPGTVISLPARDRSPDRKTTVRREPTPSEQIDQLRTTIRWLLGVLALLSVMLLCIAAMLIHTLMQPPAPQDVAKSEIGKNYTTTESATRP